MEWIRQTGAFGLMVLATAGGVIAGALYAAVVRGPRRVAVVILVLSVLPAGVGLAGMIERIVHGPGHDAPYRMPTPKDYALNIMVANRCMLLGLAGTALAIAAGAVAYVRSARPEDPPPDVPDA
jgi:hypothetical protein